ncbi:duf614 domain containing protein [Grosmannia clavigera kw1407]|uniref:Duf614 domain containing protein n=1 Tax=Grosmannia clavigera (strain kw1407 / UAMH 11150) TaxID=655863 RepID=F0XAB6_GROCL|nr:duf614 domain containing protein [Grosmannia clavigera kw1407]EFX05939.1 duf614 domain containing protein [Grosmannia clavigera kw1407]
MESKGQMPPYATTPMAQPAQYQYEHDPHPSQQTAYQPEVQAAPQQYQQTQQPEQYRAVQPMQMATAAVPGGWQSDLLDCTPLSTCCLGTWLPCLLLGQTAERMRNPANQNPDGCNADCMVLCAIQYCTGCGWIYVMVKRSEIRQQLGIKGNGASDCCTSYWCTCCAVIQQEKEVVARTGGAAPITQGYQAQSSMQMPQK